MNFWVASPDWGFWIVVYFYLGGIAAGSYFLAILIEWFGCEEDQALARIAYRIAFPLILICTVCLIVDLNRPERFWHMVLKSEVTKEAFAQGFPFTGTGWRLAAHAPAFKYWSPMSAGSWGLMVFGVCSFASFLAAMWPNSLPGRWLLRRWPHLILHLFGCVAAFFIASYTGALLTATNQSPWSETPWLAPLFLASAASTSLATMTLIAWWRNLGTPAARERLAGAEPLALGLELIVLGAFAVSLGVYLGPVLQTWSGEAMIFGTLAVGVLAPLLLHAMVGNRRAWGVPAAAACVLVGGLLLRSGVVTNPAELRARGPAIEASFGPEENRHPGARGADFDNRRGPDAMPPSKLPLESAEQE
jgi:formate-dependent nitrite reductase membrane component NrfD